MKIVFQARKLAPCQLVGLSHRLTFPEDSIVELVASVQAVPLSRALPTSQAAVSAAVMQNSTLIPLIPPGIFAAEQIVQAKKMENGANPIPLVARTSTFRYRKPPQQQDTPPPSLYPPNGSSNRKGGEGGVDDPLGHPPLKPAGEDSFPLILNPYPRGSEELSSEEEREDTKLDYVKRAREGSLGSADVRPSLSVDADDVNTGQDTARLEMRNRPASATTAVTAGGLGGRNTPFTLTLIPSMRWGQGVGQQANQQVFFSSLSFVHGYRIVR